MFTAKKQSVGVWGKVAVCIQRGSAVALVVLVPWHIVELIADAHLNQISFFFLRGGGHSVSQDWYMFPFHSNTQGPSPRAILGHALRRQCCGDLQGVRYASPQRMQLA
uniref:Uncharacterized protein n=1 Tax=Eutreptiella gymnastica TaxID=73025 RepID=A0A7S4FXU6_9EUGL